MCFRDKEEQLVRLRDSQRHQAQQAESALENFKKQVELSSEKTYADMKQQVSRGHLHATVYSVTRTQRKNARFMKVSLHQADGSCRSVSPSLFTDPLTIGLKIDPKCVHTEICLSY